MINEDHEEIVGAPRLINEVQMPKLKQNPKAEAQMANKTQMPKCQRAWGEGLRTGG
jgi:hypothetical protein